MQKNTGLGKGLEALFGTVEKVNGIENVSVATVNIKDVEPNMGQPRKYFDDEKISELAESIKNHGIIQPLIVSKEGSIYKIIAGERRWRAAKQAGLTEIPVVVKDVTPREIMEYAIIENIQREDLNPLEEAEAYEKLSKEHNMTQETIAESVGRSRPAIANTMRLISLCEDVKKLIIDGSLSAGHAKCLVSIKEEDLQRKAANEIIKASMNVRQAESYIKKLTSISEEDSVSSNKEKEDSKDIVQIKFLENELREILNTKVSIKEENNKGKIEIEYYSSDERERILEVLQQCK